MIGLRRSDQDRLLDPVTDEFNINPPFTDDDLASANRDVLCKVADATDASNDSVNETQPNDVIGTTLLRTGSLSSISAMSGTNAKAALTRIMATSLRDIAERTGQTRFVVDGQIIDITARPLARGSRVRASLGTGR